MAEAAKAPEKKKKAVKAYKPASKFCAKCGARMGDHKDRYACGKCGYTEWKKK
jgi:ubiquitin-small subunit ribosomal protein S27Ae